MYRDMLRDMLRQRSVTSRRHGFIIAASLVGVMASSLALCHRVPSEWRVGRAESLGLVSTSGRASGLHVKSVVGVGGVE
jgi:hypothetical protein